MLGLGDNTPNPALKTPLNLLPTEDEKALFKTLVPPKDGSKIRIRPDMTLDVPVLGVRGRHHREHVAKEAK
ncbi:MAG: hypothetical protein AABY80_01150 [Candidatus Deferrimicrobiota bacterium]